MHHHLSTGSLFFCVCFVLFFFVTPNRTLFGHLRFLCARFVWFASRVNVVLFPVASFRPSVICQNSWLESRSIGTDLVAFHDEPVNCLFLFLRPRLPVVESLSLSIGAVVVVCVCFFFLFNILKPAYRATLARLGLTDFCYATAVLFFGGLSLSSCCLRSPSVCVSVCVCAIANWWAAGRSLRCAKKKCVCT